MTCKHYLSFMFLKLWRGNAIAKLAKNTSCKVCSTKSNNKMFGLPIVTFVMNAIVFLAVSAANNGQYSGECVATYPVAL